MRLLKRFRSCVGKTENNPSIALEDVFDILHSSRRRRVIEIMRDVDGQLSIRELANRVADGEDDASRQAVYIALYQSHLPKMDRHNVLHYDQEDGIVTPGENFESLSRALSCVQKQCR